MTESMALIDCPDGADFKFGILIQKKDIFVSVDGRLPNGSEISQALKKYSNKDILGLYGEKAYHTFAAALSPDAAVPEGFKRIPYRNVFVTEPAEYAAVVARAALLLDWLHHTKYCASCGSHLYLSTTETALECPQCRRIWYPVLAPCIIVLISKGEQILLARHVQHISDLYTCIAGFVRHKIEIFIVIRRIGIRRVVYTKGRFEHIILFQSAAEKTKAAYCKRKQFV